jgi:hypothetical protein
MFFILSNSLLELGCAEAWCILRGLSSSLVALRTGGSVIIINPIFLKVLICDIGDNQLAL